MIIDEYLCKCADNNIYTIYTSFRKAERTLIQHYDPVCSISGGSDSDIVLDLIHKVDEDGKVKYFWIDIDELYNSTDPSVRSKWRSISKNGSKLIVEQLLEYLEIDVIQNSGTDDHKYLS